MEISQHWRLKKERYNLVGTECPQCGYKSFPPREVCPRCAAQTHTLAAPEEATQTARTKAAA